VSRSEGRRQRRPPRTRSRREARRTRRAELVVDGGLLGRRLAVVRRVRVLAVGAVLTARERLREVGVVAVEEARAVRVLAAAVLEEAALAASEEEREEERVSLDQNLGNDGDEQRGGAYQVPEARSQVPLSQLSSDEQSAPAIPQK